MAKKSVKLYTDNVLEEFYRHVIDGNLEELHIPHRTFTLEHVEWAMREEGWTDGST